MDGRHIFSALESFIDLPQDWDDEVRQQISDVSAFKFRRRERVADVTLETPLIGLIIKGSKEIHAGGFVQECGPGMVMLMPRGLRCDAVNIPDEETGLYLSMMIEVRGPLLENFRQAYHGEIEAMRQHHPRPETPCMNVHPTPPLWSAIMHFVRSGKEEGIALSTVVEHRIQEILLLLLHEPGAMHYMGLVEEEPIDRLMARIAQEPARNWTLALAAREAGMSVSTLKRRLGEREVSFTTLLTETRMRRARDLLGRTEMSIQEVALSCGYESSGYFARRFREVFGLAPSEYQKGTAQTI
ncbi:AraC family transcriptional regulator [Aestuariispira ectoiniformans]|mgnify:CR=1 FL=1|uniref:AraC family transcriptional regulator n=1 Tax=Aestuariispira ectoiniformans TaxID=2775080 RepID=UPI00223A978A|nr:AraC family transcriptional regulator [Aestuariispira ectoiniformans]